MSSRRFLDGEEGPLFQQALDQNCDGIVLAPGDPGQARGWIRKAARKGVPVVCVSTDAPGSERLTSVSTDPYTSGAMVGELMSRMIPGPVKLAFATGSLSAEDHAEKLRGFRTSVGAFSQSTIVTILEAHDEEQLAYEQTSDLLRAHPDLKGLYVSTANSPAAIQAVSDHGKCGSVLIITTDLFPALLPSIRSGQVAATMHQRPATQGRIAFQALHRFLVEGRCPPSHIKLAPHVVMRSNLDLILERVSFEWDEVGESSPSSAPGEASGDSR